MSTLDSLLILALTYIYSISLLFQCALLSSTLTGRDLSPKMTSSTSSSFSTTETSGAMPRWAWKELRTARRVEDFCHLRMYAICTELFLRCCFPYSVFRLHSCEALFQRDGESMRAYTSTWAHFLKECCTHTPLVAHTVIFSFY